MSLRSQVLKVVALAAVVLVPAVAYADVDGGKGTVASVTVNESYADDYAIERGNVTINEGSTTRKYQWGGTACNGKNLSDENILLLIEAMQNKDRLEVVPSYKSGAGQARCLVGFRIQVIAPAAAN
jgi:hypothetical protein